MLKLSNFKDFALKELKAINKLLEMEEKRKKINIELIIKLELHKHDLKKVLKFYYDN